MNKISDSKEEPIAEMWMLFVPPKNDYPEPIMPATGQRGIPVRLAIGLPTKVQNHGPSFCTVYLDGLRSPAKLVGEDSMQSLCQAVNFLRNTLLFFRKEGWQLEEHINIEGEELDDHADDAEPDSLLEGDPQIDLETIFGKLS